MKVVIIGGVAGGATAAARLRRLDEQAQIVVLEKTGFVSYANCGLPYYIGGVIEDESDLTLQTPQSFAARFGVDVRIKNEALAIDRQNKTFWHIPSSAAGLSADPAHRFCILPISVRLHQWKDLLHNNKPACYNNNSDIRSAILPAL